MKKLLLALMCLLALPAIVLAQEEKPIVEIDRICYEINGDEAIVTDGRNAHGSIVIPSEVEFEGKMYPVTAIGDYAFRSNDYGLTIISHVEIPSTIQSIGDGAFSQTALEEIEIPETVKTIGSWAFANSGMMKKVVLYGGKEGLGNDLFDQSYSLKTVVIGEGHTVIPPGMCSNCSSLEEVSLPSTLKEIQSNEYKDGAFRSCLGLKSVSFPEGLVSIGSNSFMMTGLTSVDLPDSVTSIGDSSFSDCTSLVSVKLSSSLTEIPIGAFARCTALETIEIPAGVTALNGVKEYDGCFAYCSSLSSVKLDNALSEIGNFAFYKCAALTEINFPTSLVSIGESAFQDCSSLRSIEIGPALESIGESCFNDLTSLETITVDPSNEYFSSVEGMLADRNQTELILAPKNISGILTLPSSIRTLKSGVFSACVNLSCLKLNEGLENIESFVISGCTSLSELVIPSSVNYIATDAFRDNSLSSFTVDMNNPYFSSREGLLLDKEERVVRLGVVSANTLTLPATVKIIAEKAFSHFDVSELICNEGLDVIGQEAFLQSSIERISFSTTLTAIMKDAFQSCGNLKSVVFPSSLTTLGSGAFMVSGVEEVVFTGGVKAVPSHLFAYCAGLKKIDLTGIESIGYSAFSGNCIESLSIPTTVYYIGDYAFQPSWDNIKSVKCYAKEPPVLGGRSIFGYSWESGAVEVQVPESSLDLYRNAEYWRDYLLIGFDDEVSTVMPTVESGADHWTVYALDGRLVIDTDDYGRVSTLAPGLYIINGKKTLIR